MPVGTKPAWVMGDIERAREALVTGGLGRTPEETANHLYAQWYICPRPVQRMTARKLPAAYRAVHRAAQHFEPGWITEDLRPDLGPGTVVAIRGEDRRVLSAIDYVREDGGLGLPSIGSALRVHQRRDRVSGGFWHTWTGDWPARRSGSIARVYWNVPLDAAIDFAALWSEAAADLPAHAMKLLAIPEQFNRADAAVIYLLRHDVRAAMPAIKSLHASFRHRLGSDRPPMARSLGHGLAFAEDPGHECSFGAHVCALLANAAHAQPDALGSPDAFVLSVATAFAEAGLALEAPHLAAPGPTPR